MKTIEQLLQLSKNPYYVFSNDEKAVLDDFLLKKQKKTSKKPRKKNSKSSDKDSPVRVRNIVEKTMPKPEEFEKDQS